MPPSKQPTAEPESAPGEHLPRYKMRLKSDEFLVDFGGRVPARGVVIVDEPTAVRWIETGIAEQVSADTPTFRDQKRKAAASLLRRDQVVDEREAGRFSDMISRDPLPPRMPVRAGKRGARVNPDLAGAGVINDLADTPDDDSGDEDE